MRVVLVMNDTLQDLAKVTCKSNRAVVVNNRFGTLLVNRRYLSFFPDLRKDAGFDAKVNDLC